jgi:HYR domain-containing protein
MLTHASLLPSVASLCSLAFAGATPAQEVRSRVPGTDAAEAAASIPVAFEGFVLEPDGTPAVGAVVVSSAGGEAVTDRRGHYRLEVEVPLEAERVQVTAVGGRNAGLMVSTSVALSASPLAQVVPLQLVHGGTCQPGWLPTFGGQPGADGDVYALLEFDDGGGTALYAGGFFESAGGVAASRIARWDGSTWAPVGGGVTDIVYALAEFDDGAGPALYAAGHFTSAGGVAASNIARWDGSSWAPLGSGTSGTSIDSVFALTVYDDGSGPALYAAGAFTTAGGVAASNIARWDGSSWASLGSGTDDHVSALAVFDDGSGAALYAGGDFSTAGGVAANGLARWDGSIWSPLGTGVSGAGSDVLALTVYDDGSGPGLYAGGSFTSAGGTPANRLARWNGSSWSALGNGVDDVVHALTAHDDGTGPALYVGGFFTTASGVAVDQVAKWDGLAWSPVGSGPGSGSPLSRVRAFTAFDGGGGPKLCAAGDFTTAGIAAASRIAMWDGATWETLDGGLSDNVLALAVYDDGSGPALYAGGDFLWAGDVAVNRIAKWDGSTWAPLGDGVDISIGYFNFPAVHALVVYDDGSGPALYAGGDFLSAGGVAVSRIAKWDGVQWTDLGGGMSGVNGAEDPTVDALAVHDDGSGPALYAGGYFTTAGGVAANRIAKWNGSSWSALGSGMAGIGTLAVLALTSYDDGSGPALYAGGTFTTAGGVSAHRIARWNGSSWTSLGIGVNGAVRALTVFDDGDGPALYAGGSFTQAGGVIARRVATWNGAVWSSLGGTSMDGDVRSLTAFDDGSGPSLCAGGAFTTAGGVAANGIARWDGSSWTALGGGMGVEGASVLALTVVGQGDPQTLYAGGAFAMAVDSGDSFLARYEGCPDSRPPDLDCPASVLVKDMLVSPPDEIVFYSVTATDNFDPAPSVVCVPPSGSLFPHGTTLVTCTATDASGNISTCQFPVTVQIHARRR